MQKRKKFRFASIRKCPLIKFHYVSSPYLRVTKYFSTVDPKSLIIHGQWNGGLVVAARQVEMRMLEHLLLVHFVLLLRLAQSLVLTLNELTKQALVEHL